MQLFESTQACRPLATGARPRRLGRQSSVVATAYAFGRLSDEIGRRPVLLAGARAVRRWDDRVPGRARRDPAPDRTGPLRALRAGLLFTGLIAILATAGSAHLLAEDRSPKPAGRAGRPDTTALMRRPARTRGMRSRGRRLVPLAAEAVLEEQPGPRCQRRRGAAAPDDRHSDREPCIRDRGGIAASIGRVVHCADTRS
jgi:hypothetical protein